jgi:hypothetical protein
MSADAGPTIIQCLDEPDLFKPHFKGESLRGVAGLPQGAVGALLERRFPLPAPSPIQAEDRRRNAAPASPNALLLRERDQLP